MANSTVRLTKPQLPLERKLKETPDRKLMLEWIKLSAGELEHKLRYSKEETQVLQGAVRALDDLLDVLRT